MVITLTPDLAAALNDAARKKGVAAELLALDSLRERFLYSTSSFEPRDEWERGLLAAATNCGVSLSDEAVGSEGLYE